MGLKDWRERARMLKELAARQLIERLEEEPLVGEATERLRRWLGEPVGAGDGEPTSAREPVPSPSSAGPERVAAREVEATEGAGVEGATDLEATGAAEPPSEDLPSEDPEIAGAPSPRPAEGAEGPADDVALEPSGAAAGPAESAPPRAEDATAGDDDTSRSAEARDERPPLVSAALARLLAEQGKLRMAAAVAEQVLARGEDEALARELGCWWAADAASRGEVAEGCFPVATQHGTLSIGWAVSEARLQRTGKLLAGTPSLTVRLVSWGLDEAGRPRRRLLERPASGSVGYVRFDGLAAGERVVVSVGLRSGERFVSAVHAGPLAVA